MTPEQALEKIREDVMQALLAEHTIGPAGTGTRVVRICRSRLNLAEALAKFTVRYSFEHEGTTEEECGDATVCFVNLGDVRAARHVLVEAARR